MYFRRNEFLIDYNGRNNYMKMFLYLQLYNIYHLKDDALNKSTFI